MSDQDQVELLLPRCSHCGLQAPLTGTFCPRCGARVNETTRHISSGETSAATIGCVGALFGAGTTCLCFVAGLGFIGKPGTNQPSVVLCLLLIGLGFIACLVIMVKWLVSLFRQKH